MKALPFKSSLLSVFFVACPSPRWYLHCGDGLGIPKPSQLGQAEDRSMVYVSYGNVGGSGLKRQVCKDAGSLRNKTTRTVKGWDWHDLKSWN